MIGQVCDWMLEFVIGQVRFPTILYYPLGRVYRHDSDDVQKVGSAPILSKTSEYKFVIYFWDDTIESNWGHNSSSSQSVATCTQSQ